jgi:hypothetical protein
MNDWTADELDRVGHVEELELASHRADGILHPYVAMRVE